MTSEGFDCPGCGLHMAGFRPDPGNSWQVIVNPYDPFPTGRSGRTVLACPPET